METLVATLPKNLLICILTHNHVSVTKTLVRGLLHNLSDLDRSVIKQIYFCDSASTDKTVPFLKHICSQFNWNLIEIGENCPVKGINIVYKMDKEADILILSNDHYPFPNSIWTLKYWIFSPR